MNEKKSAPTSNGSQRQLVEMHWDPITRIVGSLGIHTKIDFSNRQVDILIDCKGHVEHVIAPVCTRAMSSVLFYR